eukprot:1435754-Amphidinium_carterae.1
MGKQNAMRMKTSVRLLPVRNPPALYVRSMHTMQMMLELTLLAKAEKTWVPVDCLDTTSVEQELIKPIGVLECLPLSGQRGLCGFEFHLLDLPFFVFVLLTVAVCAAWESELEHLLTTTMNYAQLIAVLNNY